MALRQRWRREQRRRKREAEASKPELAVPLADRDRVRERIVRAVLELAEPYRTAVLLRYLDGLTCDGDTDLSRTIDEFLARRPKPG